MLIYYILSIFICEMQDIYTGTLTAEQINAIAIDGITITAVDELAIRGHADTSLGVNPKLVWQCADSDGTSSIRDTPTNAGGGVTEADTLFWEVNGHDADGTLEAYRGGIYVSGTTGSWANFIVHGTFQLGNGSGFDNAPWGVTLDGSMRWKPTDGEGRVCGINPAGGRLRLAAGENYIRVNEPSASGSLVDFVTLIGGTSQAVASVNMDGSITSGGITTGGIIVSGLGGDALNTSAVYNTDHTSLVVTRDGAAQTYTITLGTDGRINGFSTDSIATSITYSDDGLGLTVTTNGLAETYTLTKNVDGKVDTITSGTGASTTITY